MNDGLRWVFLDLGNVLWIDEPMLCAHWMALQDLLYEAGQDTPFDRLMALREALVREQQDATPHVTATRMLLGEAGWPAVQARVRQRTAGFWHQYNVVVPGASELLSDLPACCSLAVAANQPASARQRLDELGWLGYFQFVGISEEMRAEKPDAAFFQSLLAQAGCVEEPGRVVMVGDRLDNDILPAQKLGLRTIWVVLDAARAGYCTEEPCHVAYRQSLRRAPSRGRGPMVVQPEVTVRNLADLRAAIRAML